MLRVSVITIPGSYWLYHKKNIYKLIVRYHRKMKKVPWFPFIGEELFKIIRTIITSYPADGQKFRTPHLLVTYNRTFWTQQDRITGRKKFRREINEVEFSHAFVLTVKVKPRDARSRAITSVRIL